MKQIQSLDMDIGNWIFRISIKDDKTLIPPYKGAPALSVYKILYLSAPLFLFSSFLPFFSHSHLSWYTKSLALFVV